MAKTPQVGEAAPDFELAGTAGPFKLSEHRGERVVLLFYPGDNTPVCTKQFCSYRDRAEDFAALSATVVGISSQDLESHARVRRQACAQRPAAGRRRQGRWRGLQRVLVAAGDQAGGDRDRRGGRSCATVTTTCSGWTTSRLTSSRRCSTGWRAVAAQLSVGAQCAWAAAPTAAVSRSAGRSAAARAAYRSTSSSWRLRGLLRRGRASGGARRPRRRAPTSSGCRRRRVRACRAARRAVGRRRSARRARRGGRGCAASGRRRRCRSVCSPSRSKA